MEDNVKEQNKGFFREALVISVSNFAVKIIGVLFKIPLTNILDGAMGAFNAAYSIYAMLYMVSTAGLPVAISKMVAESSGKGRRKEVKRIFSLALLIFGIIGLVASLFMFFGAESIAAWSEHKNASLAMKVISPTLFLICIASAIRGYFQGLRNMVPTAASQFIEAFLKMVFGVGGAYYAKKMGYSGEVQAAFAIVGLTVGVLVGTVYLALYKWLSKRQYVESIEKKCKSYKKLGKGIAAIAIPVTITSSALYLSSFMDTLVINKRLIHAGFSNEVADYIYTAYTSLTIAISELLPSTFVYPIAVSILPFVSGALAAKRYKEAKKNIVNSIRLSGIIALPCAAIICALAKPCIGFIYGTTYNYSITLLNGTEVSPLDVAAPALSILGIGIFFISMVSTTNSLLQACGKPMLPVVSVLCGVVLLTTCEIFLVGSPKVGIYGAPISSIVCYVTAFILNFYFLKKNQKLKLNIFRIFAKNAVCAVLSGLSAFGTYKLIQCFVGLDTRMDCLLCLAPAGVVAVAVYLVSTLICKGVSAEEVELLPKGRTLASFLKRKNLL